MRAPGIRAGYAIMERLPGHQTLYRVAPIGAQSIIERGTGAGYRLTCTLDGRTLTPNPARNRRPRGARTRQQARRLALRQPDDGCRRRESVGRRLQEVVR